MLTRNAAIEIRIEAITYPTDYFHESDPFIEEIKKEGIVIHHRVENLKLKVENKINNETVQ